jgi:hypothetical protein
MKYDDRLYISLKDMAEDYLLLRLDENACNGDWVNAIDIFHRRIHGRFINVIDKLMHDVPSNGFAIMALNCLLVETLHQFVVGENESGSSQNSRIGRNHLGLFPSNNRDIYISFLRGAFPGIFPCHKTAKLFYTDIRCGILHSAQTKGFSRLTVGQENAVEIINDNTAISVDVKLFTQALRQFLDDYSTALMTDGEMHQLHKHMSYYTEHANDGYMLLSLRGAFIKKMNHICRVAEV